MGDNSSETSVSPTRTVEIDAHLLTALDRHVVANGLHDRSALVNKVLSEWLRRADESAQQAIYTRSVLKRELLGDPDEYEPDVAYELELREINVATKPRKLIVFRRLWGRDGGFYDSRPFSFSIGGATWVRERLLPWLAQSLKEAEEAHRNEVADTRRRAQARRANRSDEEKAREAESRHQYSERYGKDRWRYAVNQANRHRCRAEGHRLTDHFTAAQWLECAARSAFRCPLCGGNAALQTHHIRDLSAGGGNTMDNIQLLCATCHIKVGQRGEDAADEWLAQEMEQFRRCRVGDLVQRVPTSGTRLVTRGEVLEVLPPTRGAGPLWCHRHRNSAPNGMGGKLIMPREPLFPEHIQDGYQPTRVRVMWTGPMGGKPHKQLLRPRDVVMCSSDSGERSTRGPADAAEIGTVEDDRP